MDITSQQLAAKLVPQLPGLRLDQLEIDHEKIIITLTASAPGSNCPLCGTLATRVHSFYARTLADLPWAGYTVRLQLSVRKFHCKCANCLRRIFTERLPELVAPYARRSARLSLIIRVIGLALGGQGGARLTARLGMSVSSSTLLRHIRRAPSAPSSTTSPSSTVSTSRASPHDVPRVLGVDDFAFRRGHTYGTILVDLEQHRPIELLPDRTAETLAEWLRKHPGVEVISRDRSTEYRRGATLGAPQALQIADRFHIVKNLREAAERVVDRNRSKLADIQLPRVLRTPRASSGTTMCITTGTTGSNGGVMIPSEAARRPARRSPAETIGRQLHRVERQQQYEQVKAMHAAGESTRTIARQLGLSRGTVFHYLRSDQDPTGSQWRRKHSQLDPYLPYLYQRWQDGCENAAQLLRELHEQGYTGSRRMVATWVTQRRRVPAKTGPRKGHHDGDDHDYMEYSQQEPAQRQDAGQDHGLNVAAQGRQQATKPKPPKQERTPSSIQYSYFLIREPDSLTMEEQATLKQLQQASADLAEGYPLLQEFLTMVHQRTGKEQLDIWLSKAKSSSLVDLRNFAAGLERDKVAVRAGLSEEWSNGQTEGQVNRLKLKKREMYGRAKFDLLQRRVLDAA
ncbi:MAG: ISL3 family transposase [Chloroflexota bacterium]|nr:ISL3 family transposase [Chloroflexota bacterium]